MDAKNPLDVLDGSSGHASGRLAEILGGIDDLPQVPGILWDWLQTGSAAGWWPYAFLPLALVYVGGARFAMAATHWILERRRGPMARGAVRRPVFAWVIGLLTGVVLFLLSEALAGPPRQIASAILVTFLLAHLVNILTRSVLERYRPALAGERLAALDKAIALARFVTNYAFGLLALSLIMHRAAVPTEPRILVGSLLLISLGVLGLILIQHLKHSGVVLPPLAPEQQKRRTLLLRAFSHIWTKFYSLFIAAMVIIGIWSALDAMDSALLRAWASLVFFGVVPLLITLVGDLLPDDQAEMPVAQVPASHGLVSHGLAPEGLAAHGQVLPGQVSHGQVQSPWHHTFVHALRLLLVALAWFGLASVWGMNLLDLANNGLGERVADGVISTALVLLLSHLAWEVIRTVIDVHAGMKPLSHDADVDDPASHGTHSASRLQTFAPLLRKFLFSVLVIMAVCLILSSIGVEIGPLLAGAGVFGLAIGFGAQTLVRDIVSGIFYLMDDAFRIGEYVDIGGTMGTVEGMSIRSLRLRHQQGMIHTVPFGEITKLTNFSRDWAIIKLQFTLGFETDVEKVRKLVKKVNAELQADPTYGPTMLGPLKSQGVRGTTPIGLIIGVKFTAKPGTQFPLRREVYRRVRDIFVQNGIEFARPNVLVHTAGGGGGGGAVLDQQTAAAAAQAAMEQVEKKTS